MKRAHQRIDSYNTGYVQDLFDRYLQNPAFVPESWQQVFASGWAAEAGLLGADRVGVNGAAPLGPQLRAARAAAELFDAYRLNGHWAARVDPFETPPIGHPMLDPAFHGTSVDELAQMPAALLGVEHPGPTLADVLEWLKRTYSGPIGYEFEHLEDPRRREWMRRRIESWQYRAPLSTTDQRQLLGRLSQVEAFEQFLHRAYLGQKRFSLEGTEMLVPMLDTALDQCAQAGARQVVLGMAHRGRLNVLTHVLGRPYSALIAQFEGRHSGFGTTGDVKYHLGASGTYTTPSGQNVLVELAPNPSHLEYVNPIVEGMSRARQCRAEGNRLTRDPDAVLPILIHGDAAFAGQGVVAETLNLALLDGYATGGTLHIIVNNQIGFTTDPRAARSTHYASGMARGYRVPIFHVNADDPEACLAVVRMALDYRAEFHADVLIDLIGYRRFGHNEADEPAYTQPLLYHQIQHHHPVRRLWGDQLIQRGVAAEADVDAEWQRAYEQVRAAQDEVRQTPAVLPSTEPSGGFAQNGRSLTTPVSRERLLALDAAIHSWPADFHVLPKLASALQRRSRVLAADGEIDWAHAEALALGSLLEEGTAIRMTGQDVERGTFSQRHLVLHDHEARRSHTPLANLETAQAPFEIHNSPLSEMAPLGFEYGYSIAWPQVLVLWEAQFGDFANAAQVIIDQFITAGRAKWGQSSRLALLLPHGYEGQGPEHSSARLERFLQLAAEDNIFVESCTTPAQYFHLLRRQAKLHSPRPLVLMTPKSLLRHPRAVSRLQDLTDSRFQPLIEDADARDRRQDISRLILCTGKVYYDLVGSPRRSAADQLAITRVEELYPFPGDELLGLIESYPALKEVIWVQEEPKNMGAWSYVEQRLRMLLGSEVALRYIGRPERASPAEGYANVHERNQSELIEAALTVVAPRPKARKAGRH